MGMRYTCTSCGETRFFYTEIFVKAKQRIDLKNGSRHKKTYDIEPDHIDGFYEDIIYCAKCNEQVDMDEWADYED
ncbi:hypothetical protein PCURB6_27760 [Paenibacillus curdlanolyticus]|nr:hypothetical protein PCURB6_27760 [Paenibacillus curdlanolyticus]